MLNEVETQGVVFCQTNEGEKIYYLNDTSLAVVMFLQRGNKNIEEILTQILSLFDVQESECKNDIVELLKKLEDYHIIEAFDSF
jgi:hypothetical protein